MPLRLATITDRIEIHRALEQEEERAAYEAVSAMRAFLDEFRTYATMLYNYNDVSEALVQHENEFTQSGHAITTSQRIDIMMLDANRLLSNFLSSAKAYLDHTSRRLGAQDRDALGRFNLWTNVFYDECVSYRIFENLRRIAQHQEVPIRAYSASRERRLDGSYSSSQTLLIDRAAFLDCEIQAPVRNELRAWQGNVPVREHLAAYFDRLQKIELLRQREAIGRFEPHAAFLDVLVSGVGNPRQAPIYLIDHTEENAGYETRLQMNLIDVHYHAIFLVQQVATMIRATDFTDIDTLIANHARA